MPLLKCYGWRRDEYDPRDFPFRTERTSFPRSVDLREKFPAAYSQGHLHSCIGNALGAAIQFEQRRQTIEEFLPSRLFIYYNARAAENAIRMDQGARPRDGMKAVAKHGVPPESAWPYLVRKFAREPLPHVYHKAKENRVTEYLRLNDDLNSMKACLADGYPFIFGMMLYESFETHKVRRTGMVPMPSPEREKTVGGHAMVAVGYDQAEKVFIVRNSWGPDWGKEGYCFIPYPYFLDPKLAEDFWTVRMVSEKQVEAEKERTEKAIAAYAGKS